MPAACRSRVKTVPERARKAICSQSGPPFLRCAVLTGQDAALTGKDNALTGQYAVLTGQDAALTGKDNALRGMNSGYRWDAWTPLLR